MFFPTNPVWFRRSSYSDLLARDARRIAPRVEWSNPPAGRVEVDGRHVPQPQQSQLRSQESPDAWYETQQSEGGTQQERPPHSSDEADLQNVGDGPQHKKKFPTEDQPKTWERYEPSSKGMDQNEHRTRRHKYEIGPLPSLKKFADARREIARRKNIYHGSKRTNLTNF